MTTTRVRGAQALMPAPDVTPYPVESSAGFRVGDIVTVEGQGYLKVAYIDADPTFLDLVNLENANNAPVGTVAAPGARISNSAKTPMSGTGTLAPPISILPAAGTGGWPLYQDKKP